MVFGLCAGVAAYFRLDPTLVRVAFLLVAVFTGFPFILYFLLAMIVPKEPIDSFMPHYMPDIPPAHDLDREMERIEKQALQREIHRLRTELAKWQAR